MLSLCAHLSTVNFYSVLCRLGWVYVCTTKNTHTHARGDFKSSTVKYDYIKYCNRVKY